jgi:uncharacterized membrane protein YjgN (DUF898 family)
MHSIKHYAIDFTGRGSEYFRIWIVNVALSIITLGIYSAWAKVRTMRWFYGHTFLDNHSFSYLATPMQILRGRLIAVILLVLYVGTSKFAPLVSALIILAIGIASPWIIVMALRFGARQSAYRGLRFNFTGTVGEAATVYLFMPILSVITFGLAIPYVAYTQLKFLATHYTYGTVTTSYSGSSKPFWKLYLLTLTFLAVVWGIMGSLIYYYILTHPALSPEAKKQIGVTAVSFGLLAFYITIPIAVAIIKTQTINLFYNHLHLEDVRFHSTQRVRDVLWIYITNLLLIMITLGFYTPFASVRLARYRSLHLEIIAANLDEFAAQTYTTTTAVGSEISDLFDMDIGVA